MGRWVTVQCTILYLRVHNNNVIHSFIELTILLIKYYFSDLNHNVKYNLSILILTLDLNTDVAFIRESKNKFDTAHECQSLF